MEICSEDKDEERLEESVFGNTDDVEAWLSLSPLLHVWVFWFSFSLPSNMFFDYDDEMKFDKETSCTNVFYLY